MTRPVSPRKAFHATSVPRVLAVALLFYFFTNISSLHAQAPQPLSISATAQPLSTFIGLGVEFDPYEKTPTPEHWNIMMQRLAFMHPGFLRVMSNTSDYLSGLDADGKPILRWKTNPNDPHLQRMYDVLDFAQAHNIPVYLGEWSPPTQFGIKPGDPRWASMIAEFVQYLIRERHYTIVHHYIMMNEPHGDWSWPKPARPDFAAWQTGIKQLRAEFDGRNLQQVTLAGPDADAHWITAATQKMPTLFTGWEEHIYAKDEDLLTGKLESDLTALGKVILANDPHGADKPRFIGEAGIATGKVTEYDQQPRVRDFDYGVLMADFTVQVARAGWSGLSAWDLDDAMHEGPKGGLKIWGFWDSTTDQSMAPRPWFGIWSALSRALPAGAQILPVEGPNMPIRATAAAWHSNRGTQYTVVLVNESNAPASMNIQLPVKANWHIWRYLSADQTTSLGNLRMESRDSKPFDHQALTISTRGVIILSTE